MKRENIGSSFDDFLREDGLYDEVAGAAAKRVLTRKISEPIAQPKLTNAKSQAVREK